MSYNQYGASPYGRPPGFGSFPGQSGSPPGMGPPPGMGAPPGMSAPGTAPPPGIQQANAPQGGRPSGLPASFQGAANMPNINFSAPVIRLGTGPTKPATPTSAGGRQDPSSAGGSRLGLGAERGGGMDAQRQALRESMMSLAPPTKEEIVRTIFVGGITEGCGGDEGVEKILSTAGRLRRWDRAVDANGKQCSFGFAQYDDAESLSVAVEVLKDIEVPKKKQQPAADGAKKGEEVKFENFEKAKLLVFVDDNSLNYLENYHSSRGDDIAGDQARLDAAKSRLKEALHDLFYPPAYVPQEHRNDDVTMQDVDDRGENVEVVNIPLAVDDELADIPAEMRETVAQEIQAFRDRSTRRDMERLKREEEMEAMERMRNGAPRVSRLASPGPSIPSGPSGGANNIPLGPRGVPNAPSGPKAQGAQIPRDYQAGVKFVNGANGALGDRAWINREDEDDSASDEELENRRQAKKLAEQEKQYLDQERRWLNRERSRTAAVQREEERENEDAANANAQKEKMATLLRNWDDEVESSRKTEEYYKDHSMWTRNRAAFRAREAAADERDREAEKREQQRTLADKEQARGLADSFLDRQAEELESRPNRIAAQQPFKLSLGAAAQKAQKAAPARRTVAEVEGLLEDEEDVANSSKRTLIPIKFDPSASSAGLSDEERDQAVRQLAAEIPTEKEGLWSWDIKWDFVDDAVIVEKLRPFVEKKIVEYLGVQEQMLIEVVEDHIRGRGKPGELVELLEGALEDEAEVLVKKLWRMVIFFSESEKRGYSA
ncbi:hypothetical protein B0O99DRAFT_602157 [Bisporella sp. PMI_857]|nr:hypothetical protein B0O99DRAFT_602157 [Bisporella sp. PMI_857]